MNHRHTGAMYEERARVYLEEQGVQILEQNFRSRQGEIDIIGIEQEYLVFFEVKYRGNEKCGYPEEAVNQNKQQQICKVSDFYRYTHRQFYQFPVRYDVISIYGEEIVWYRNAFFYVTKGNYHIW